MRPNGWFLPFLGIGVALQAASLQEIRLPAGENVITAAALDEPGDAAYFAAAESDFRYSLETSSATILQVRLSDFSIRRRVVLFAGENPLQAATLDPRRRLAYFGVYGDPHRDVPGQIVQIALDPLERKQALVLPQGEFGVSSGVLDPQGGHGYFGTLFGTVAGLRLPNMELIGSLSLQREDNAFQCAVLDASGKFAYFGTAAGNITKIRLSDFTPVGNITVLRNEPGFRCAFVDSSSGDAFFGTQGAPAKLIRLSLKDFKPAGALAFSEGQNDLIAGFCPPGQAIAYLVFAGLPAQLVKIQLRPLKILSSLPLPKSIGLARCAVFDARRRAAVLGAGDNPARLIRAPLAEL